jgi:hypothetical protein
MSAFPITVQDVSSSIHQAYTVSKTTILRWGHLFKTEYAPAVVNKLSACALAALACLKSLFDSGPSTSFAVAGSLLFLSVLCFQIADRKDYENAVLGKTLWKTAGLLAFIASTVMTHLGLIACL